VRGGGDLARVLELTDDEWGDGLVDQRVVRFINEGAVQTSLHGSRTGRPVRQHAKQPGRGLPDRAAGPHAESVTQVVSRHFLGRGVGHPAGVSRPPGRFVMLRKHCTHRQTSAIVEAAQLPGITLREVVIGSDHMARHAAERLKRRRQPDGQGLSFPGVHFGKKTFHQSHGCHQLHLVGTQPQFPVGQDRENCQTFTT
jgi:hypothetical protein